MNVLKLLFVLVLLGATFAGAPADRPSVTRHPRNPVEPVGPSAPPQGAAPGAPQPAGATRLSPDDQQAIGVRFAYLDAGGASRTTQTVGKAAVDETRAGHVH